MESTEVLAKSVVGFECKVEEVGSALLSVWEVEKAAIMFGRDVWDGLQLRAVCVT